MTTNRPRHMLVLLLLFAWATIDGSALLAQSSWRVVQSGTSPGGVDLPPPFGVSTLLTESGVILEESLLALNDNYAAIVSPGDAGLLRIIDQDDEKEWIRLGGGVGQATGLFFPATGTMDERSVRVHDEAVLHLRTNGGAMFFTADEDDGLGSFVGEYLWHRGSAGANFLLEMVLAGGDLYIAGTYKTIGSPMATLFLRGEPLEHGDPVSLDATRAETVVRAYGSSPIIGVVTARPGVALGGSILSPEALGREWGSEVLARFLDQRAELETELLLENAELREQADRLATPSAFNGSESLKEEDLAGLELRFREAVQDFERRLHLAALRRFVDHNFVAVAIAGRADVKVAQAAGSFAPGDSLSLAPGSGLAVKGTGHGRRIGVALEPSSPGKATAKVLLHLGDTGGSGTLTQLAESPTDDRLAALEVRLSELLTERQELRSRLSALEAAADQESTLRLASAGSGGPSR